jgi:predicted phosphodiesterase
VGPTLTVRRKRGGNLLLTAILAVSSGCVRPAEERALRDELVGQRDANGVRISVHHGLAVVRELTPDRATLWQSAPVIDVDLERERGGDFSLTVLNTPEHADVQVFRGPAPNVVREQLGRTRVNFRFEFREPASVSLRIGDGARQAIEPFRIALMSDVQEAIDRVSDLYRRINEEPGVEFLLGAGDLTERGTEEQLSRFEQELLGLHVPYYTTLGNHELGESPPPYQDTFGRASFSFEYRGVRFTLLDSASATIDPRVYDWLDGWLSAGRDRFHVVAMHVPPIDPVGVRNGSFASRNEANLLLGRLLDADVDLTLYGHLHSYFRFQNAGIEARVSGGGGAIPERFDQIGRHFLTIDIDPERQAFESRVVPVD